MLFAFLKLSAPVFGEYILRTVILNDCFIDQYEATIFASSDLV